MGVPIGVSSLTSLRSARLAFGVLFAAVLALGAFALSALANHSAFERVSVGQVNGNGPYGATIWGTSADGSRVFFVTNEKLVATDTDTKQDVYERAGGVTSQVSVGEINGNGAFPVDFAGSSEDGTRVFFDTNERLVADDTDDVSDMYERAGGVTSRVSVGEVNGNGGNGAYNACEYSFGIFPGYTSSCRPASADGTRVFFHTTEGLVASDTDGQRDLYERSGGVTKLVSAAIPAGRDSDYDWTSFLGVSDDGARVFYSTFWPLVASDTDGQYDIYEFVNGVANQVSVGQINGNGPIGASFAGASPDGSRAFFTTDEQLVPNDTDGAQDIYERSGGVTTRVSVGKINGNSYLPANFPNAQNWTKPRGISADGTHVFFETGEQLVGNDTDGANDIYERSGSVTRRASVGQINGNGSFSAKFAGASADGSRLFFTTDEQLVPNDKDTQDDLYERAGGVTRRVSIGQVNGNGAFPVNFAGSSEDGTRVFFETAEQLVANDHDGQVDIYERFNGVTTRISNGALGGNGAFPSDFVRDSADGTRVFFHTNEPLVADDIDAQRDVYSASVAP